MDAIPERVQTRPLAALSLRHLHYFVILSNFLNFRAAAEALAITTAALSSSIKETERLIGAELLVRKGHHVALSEAGRAVLPIAVHLCNTATSAFADMKRASLGHQQTVRIALVPSVAGRVIKRLASLSALHPQLRFEFIDRSTPALIKDVEDAKVDFGIGVESEMSGSGLSTFRLMTDEIVAVVRKQDPLAREGALTWKRLDGVPVGHFIGGGIADLTGHSAAAQRVSVRARYEVSFAETLWGLAREGLCVGLVPRLTAESLPDPDLTWLPIVKPRIGRVIALIRTSQAARSPAVTLCIDHMKAGVGAWR
jgi:LysR family transcriptional regulator, carnitine catabolism transcriptional activator